MDKKKTDTNKNSPPNQGAQRSSVSDPNRKNISDTSQKGFGETQNDIDDDLDDE